MKKRLALTSVIAILFTVLLNAQAVSKDSISVLKSQKEIAELTAKLSAEKLKLAELENALPAKKEAEEKARSNAQQSADKNAKIAAGLSDNTDSKKLARQAKKAARQAKKDAKKLRKATSKLEDLQKEIESHRTKIADYETALNKMELAQ